MTDSNLLKAKQQRNEIHYPFHWPVIIEFQNAEGLITCLGATHDLSYGGCSVLTQYDIPSGNTVTVQLTLPPDRMGAERTVVEATARVVYTSPRPRTRFRSGVEFSVFRRDGRELLENAIKLQVARGAYVRLVVQCGG